MKRARDITDSINEKDEQIVGMEKRLVELKFEADERFDAAHRKWKEDEDVQVKAEFQISELEKELAARAPTDKVVSDFKKSEDYSAALAEADAAKIERCQLVAERHIKTDPEADWETFYDQYIVAEDVIAKGGPEPAPYDGPTPAFLPPVVPDHPPLT